MPKRIDMMGKRYGRLIVLEDSSEEMPGGKHRKVKTQCDCGTIKSISVGNLRRGNTRSCGCLHKEEMSMLFRTHGDNQGRKRTRLYNTWVGMKSRCRNKNEKAYKTYGGRGIKVCEEWQEYIPFKEWALANGYKKNLSIDRINSNGDYEPSNCRWATMTEQARNTRRNVFVVYQGKRMKLHEFSAKSGIDSLTIGRWNREGKSTEQMIERFNKRKEDEA